MGHAGTDGRDTNYVSNRGNLYSSPAIRVAGRKAMELAGVGPEDGVQLTPLEVALSPDGSRLLTAGADGTARLWDVSTGAELRSVEASGQGHSKQLHAASFSPDGQWIAYIGREQTGRFYH